MARIRFLPDGKVVEVDSTEPVLQASLRAGIPHTHVCGGHARCSTCRILVVSGGEHCAPRNAAEQQMANRLHFDPELRLACQTTVTGDVTVRRLVLDADDIALTDQLTASAARRFAGEERRVAVLFADIRGFTSFAEELPPYDVIHALNRYFFRVEAVIRAHRGYIDNYMGDGLLAIFGTLAPAEAPLDAVLAGLEMLEAVERLDPYFQSVYGRALRIGIGVHVGSVVLGSVGPPGHDRFTAIGDVVNFASRIEAATKATGASLLISEETWVQVKGKVEATRLEARILPGRARPCSLYSVAGPSW
jgi:adenylate cyclase